MLKHKHFSSNLHGWEEKEETVEQNHGKEGKAKTATFNPLPTTP